jgi:hypothetical protein
MCNILSYHISLCSYFRVVMSASIPHKKTMSVLLFPQLFVGGLLICYLFLFVYKGVQHLLTIWVTWWVSYKRQVLFTLSSTRVHPVFGGIRVANLFSSFLCCVVFCLSSSCVLCDQYCLPVSLNCHFWSSLWFSLTFIYQDNALIYCWLFVFFPEE